MLNRRGYDRAVAAGVDEVNVVVPASDGFAKANQNSTTEALTEVAEEVLAEAASTGPVRHGHHRDLVRLPLRRRGPARRGWSRSRGALAAAGAQEIAIADTIGVGVPTQVRALLDGVR